MKTSTINLVLYMVKACAACLIAFYSAPYLPQADATWFFISIILVLSPDSKEALPLSLIRIKGNLLASVVSLLLLLTGLPLVINICLGFCIVIFLCHLFNIMLGSRPALAAVIIIMLHPPGDNLWELAIARAVYVAAGCLVGLILTIVFHRTIEKKQKKTDPIE